MPEEGTEISVVKGARQETKGWTGRTVWMDGDGGHGVHVGLGQVLDDDRDAVLPDEDLLVVGRRHEPPVVVHERDLRRRRSRSRTKALRARSQVCESKGRQTYGVDRAEVLVVLLRDVVGAHVPLGDLLVGLADEQVVVVLRVQLDAVRDLARRVARDHLARLCVPQLENGRQKKEDQKRVSVTQMLERATNARKRKCEDLDIFVVAAGDEAGAVVVELDVADGLAVAQVSA